MQTVIVEVTFWESAIVTEDKVVEKIRNLPRVATVERLS